ncbi:Planctomycete cytochrome C [Caulifigura coniformis]|uniref:Planctomycete cytochrome C n=1 Tax=Caulifigura coniformis TaxID=2527983 RepID=A0A517SDY2_9PLAN|nr:PSD1 and planctomycete cytochrome C domain-containing protein [Caulifigura coniformis]QDT54321.1 Planctomycete cytochrome C [Caulifigura coniformis]
MRSVSQQLPSVVAFLGVIAGALPFASAADDLFHQVKPILESTCVRCHAGPEAKAGLRITSREELLKGGASGPAIDLQSPGDSLLVSAVTYDGFEMPPTGKMPQPRIDAVVAWVKAGAPWPAGQQLKIEHPVHGPPQVNEETRNHWSFRSLKQPETPQVVHADRVANPIDAFVLQKLEAKGFTLSPEADRRALIRRLTYDLIGLPPTPEEVEAFVNDPSPKAYENLVERLLASPQYGEQWGRQWLDVVRYAETNSFERDNPKPYVWRYRDYVIRAFNDDMPYDQFIREQLAGDELDQVTPDRIIATGFYRLGLWDDEPADPELAFYDGLDDIAATTAQAFLGLTMNCARCHDHKLDPIPIKDYYSFVSFFRNVRHYGKRSDDTVLEASVRSIAPAEVESKHAAEVDAWRERVKELDAVVAAFEETARQKLIGGEKDDFKSEGVRENILKRHVGTLFTEEEFGKYAAARKERNRLRRQPPKSEEQALCVKENGTTVPTSFVLLRGNPQAPGDEVTPAFPQVLSPPTPDIRVPASGESSGRRRALAEWIASPENPLTARVMVNRIWQGHFGRGLVRSTNNFGLQGDAPTHPELVDWLASEFMARGWSVKAMHRLIVMSSAYRQSSRHAPSAMGPDPLASDPQNDLLWRFDMRRLKAEEVRDSMLAVTGSLNTAAMYGPSIYVPIEDEVLAGQSRPGYGWGKSSPEDQRRRAVYIHIKRSLTVPILAAFDAADTDFTCPVRFASTQPTQALGMINGAFANEQAGKLADLALAWVRGGNDPAPQVRIMLERVTQRPATETEVERGVQLVRDLQKTHGQTRQQAMQTFALVALNLNEFLYLD